MGNPRSATWAGAGSETPERREITVLDIDLADFTRLTEARGDEEIRPVLVKLHSAVREIVTRHEGMVIAEQGDGVTAIFGAPLQHEDDPARACEAAIEAHQSLDSGSGDSTPEFRIRVGVNSGPAIIGRLAEGSGNVSAVGDVLNVAARLRELASPGQTVVGETTFRKMEGLIDAEELGVFSLKGRSRPEQAFRLNGLTRGLSRFDLAARSGLSALAGRRELIEHVLDLVSRTADTSAIIGLWGEPGIGKTRLVHEILDRIRDGSLGLPDPVDVAIVGCSQETATVPLYAILRVIRNLFGITEGESSETTRERLQSSLEDLGLGDEEDLRLMSRLLGLESDDAEPSAEYRVAESTRDLLISIIKRRAERRPIAIVIEDMHWVDSSDAPGPGLSSESLLAEIAGSLPASNLLLIFTYRPMWLSANRNGHNGAGVLRPEWVTNLVNEIEVGPLQDDDISSIVADRLDLETYRLPEQLTESARKYSGNNPLLAEELVRMWSESGAIKHSASAITFDAGLTAGRSMELASAFLSAVDRLPEGPRQALQTAALIERDFPAWLIYDVAEDREAAETALAQLVDQRMLAVRRSSGEYLFRFRHALLQDALKQQMVSGPRQDLHLRIAEVLESRTGTSWPGAIDELALHFTESSQPDRAVEYLIRSGERRLDLYALPPAQSALEQALDLSPNLGADRERQWIPRLLASVARTLYYQSNFVRTRELLREHVELLRAESDSPDSVIALHFYLFALWHTNDFEPMDSVLEQIQSVAATQDDERSTAYALYSHVVRNLATDVDHEAAKVNEVGERALALARNVTDPYLEIAIPGMLSFYNLQRGHNRAATTYAEMAIEYGEEHGDRRATAYGSWLIGWLAIVQEQWERAREAANTGLPNCVVPQDRLMCELTLASVEARTGDRKAALAELRRIEQKCIDQGWTYVAELGLRPILAVTEIANGNLGTGLDMLETYVEERDAENYQTIADWGRLFLADSYLEFKVPRYQDGMGVLSQMGFVLRNFTTIVRGSMKAERRFRELTDEIIAHNNFDEESSYRAQVELMRGLLSRRNGDDQEAREHFETALRIAQIQGSDSIATQAQEHLGSLAEASA